jgi:hypothetical protein
VVKAARAKRMALLRQNRELQQKIWLWLHDKKGGGKSTVLHRSAASLVH